MKIKFEEVKNLAKIISNTRYEKKTPLYVCGGPFGAVNKKVTMTQKLTITMGLFKAINED